MSPRLGDVRGIRCELVLRTKSHSLPAPLLACAWRSGLMVGQPAPSTWRKRRMLRSERSARRALRRVSGRLSAQVRSVPTVTTIGTEGDDRRGLPKPSPFQVRATWQLRASPAAGSTCRQMVSTVPGRLRHVAHVAPSRCASCEERPGSADCPTCTRSNAGAVRYHIPRKVAQQDGATLTCFASLANRRGNAADWPLWLKTPKIDRFGFVCPSTG